MLGTADPSLTGCEFYGWYKEELKNDWDPDAAGANAKLWDFDKDIVTESMTLYAYFLPIYQFSNSFQLQSSTGKKGFWIDTVIGQGCKIKLKLVDQSGTVIKAPKKTVSWSMVSRPNDKYNWRNVAIKNDDNLSTYFKLKNGKIKCKKNTPVGYQIAVVAQYEKNRAYYVMTVMPKVKKMGYVLNGKVKKSITVKLTANSNCDYGYGPFHFLPEGNYVRYYDKNKASVGVALYEQPNGNSWWYKNGSGLTESERKNSGIQMCSAKLPKKAAKAVARKARAAAEKNTAA